MFPIQGGNMWIARHIGSDRIVCGARRRRGRRERTAAGATRWRHFAIAAGGTI